MSNDVPGLKSKLSVAVVGMGIEGGSLARYFLKQGADVVVHHWMALDDLKKDVKLGPQYEELAEAGAAFKTGTAYLTSLTSRDVVGVVQSAFTHRYPENIVALNEARGLGIPLVTNLSTFFDQCPAPIIGVTGTNGKSTTTEMLAGILATDSGRHTDAGERQVWTGGNLGASPLDVLDSLAADDLVVLELSNYQLEFLDESPWIAGVTNIAPDHLVDYGGDFRAYKAAKRRIIDFQTRDDWAVLNYDDPVTRAWLVACQANQFPFSRQTQLTRGAFVRDDGLVVRRNGIETTVCRTDALQVRGAHNVENALCAAAIGTLAGATPQDIAAALAAYKAGEHRLELVGKWKGVEYYNDSKSTTPASTIAAMRAFPQRSVILLAGGQDKGLPWNEFVQEVRQSVKEVILFGEARKMVGQVFAEAKGQTDLVIKDCIDLDDAVEMAIKDALLGDVVLLSPACASFDSFGSYAQRGQHFKELVRTAFPRQQL